MDKPRKVSIIGTRDRRQEDHPGHTHGDHAGGIESVLRSIPTDHFYCRASIADSLRELYGGIVTGISAGDSIAFEEGGILVMSPPENEYVIMSGENAENNASLLLRFDMNGLRLLFCGDIEESVQRLVRTWGDKLQSDVLKVPHHGAEGLNEAFLDLVAPEAAIISCGAGNRYGHPAESTLISLEQAGCGIWRTDRDGTIMVSLPSMDIQSY